MKNYKQIISSLKLPLLVALGVGSLIALNACSSRKSNTEVVSNFDIKQYKGEWYEIARFDFKHEKDMSHVTANYSLNEDGSVKVINKGYDYIKKEWKTSEGKAKFNGDSNKGALKVSFFGPFYAEYNVVMMDPNYENALVFGENTDYIWILSRNKTISESVKKKFTDYAKANGYPLEKLVWTKQD